MSSSSKQEAAVAAGGAPIVPVKFSGVVLVCGDCERRKDGPSRLRTKEARKAFKQNLGEARHKVRVMQTSCMGLCPKKAIAVAAVAGGAPLIAAEVRSEDDAAAFAGTFARSFGGPTT